MNVFICILGCLLYFLVWHFLRERSIHMFCHLTSLWSVKGDRVTVGPVALLVENVNGETVLRERFEAWNNGMSPPPWKRHGLALI